MFTLIMVILTIINAMLVWALLSQARQYRKIIRDYQEQAKRGRSEYLWQWPRDDENGSLSEGDIFRYQGKRNGD